MSRPEFESKLSIIDHQLNRWRPLVDDLVKSKPLPSSPNLAKIPEFEEGLDDYDELKRYFLRIDCDVVYPNILIGNE